MLENAVNPKKPGELLNQASPPGEADIGAVLKNEKFRLWNACGGASCVLHLGSSMCDGVVTRSDGGWV